MLNFKIERKATRSRWVWVSIAAGDMTTLEKSLFIDFLACNLPPGSCHRWEAYNAIVADNNTVTLDTITSYTLLDSYLFTVMRVFILIGVAQF